MTAVFNALVSMGYETVETRTSGWTGVWQVIAYRWLQVLVYDTGAPALQVYPRTSCQGIGDWFSSSCCRRLLSGGLLSAPCNKPDH